jgi:hypothetical protein
MDWLRGQNTAAKITTTITAAIAYKRRLSPNKSIATSGRLGTKLVTLHMRGLKRRMILLKPSRMVWPADVACQHVDLTH